MTRVVFTGIFAGCIWIQLRVKALVWWLRFWLSFQTNDFKLTLSFTIWLEVDNNRAVVTTARLKVDLITRRWVHSQTRNILRLRGGKSSLSWARLGCCCRPHLYSTHTCLRMRAELERESIIQAEQTRLYCITLKIMWPEFRASSSPALLFVEGERAEASSSPRLLTAFCGARRRWDRRNHL